MRKPPRLRRLRRERFEAFTADPDKAMLVITAHSASGKGLPSLCLGLDIPVTTLQDWINADALRVSAYAQARRTGAAHLAEQSLSILDEVERDKDGMPTSATVQLVKAKSDSLKWLAARISPPDWGDSLHMTGEVSVKVDIRGILEKREQRLKELIVEQVECVPISALPSVERARESQQVFQQSPETMNHDNP
jgi:hypothetical protein